MRVDPTEEAVRAAWTATGRIEAFRTEEQRDRAVAKEAQRIDGLASAMMLDLRRAEIQTYRDQHQGHHPPYWETVQLGERAARTAREIVWAQELEVPDEDLMEPESPPDPELVNLETNPDRWKIAPDRVTWPTPEIEALVDEIWQERPIGFRAMAGSLMQTRYEDSEPYPTTPTHPLVPAFTAQLEEHEDRLAQVRTRAEELNRSSSRSPRMSPVQPRSPRRV